MKVIARKQNEFACPHLEGGTIANLSSGDRQPIRNLTEEFLERLRERLGR